MCRTFIRTPKEPSKKIFYVEDPSSLWNIEENNPTESKHDSQTLPGKNIEFTVNQFPMGDLNKNPNPETVSLITIYFLTLLLFSHLYLLF